MNDMIKSFKEFKAYWVCVAGKDALNDRKIWTSPKGFLGGALIVMVRLYFSDTKAMAAILQNGIITFIIAWLAIALCRIIFLAPVKTYNKLLDLEKISEVQLVIESVKIDSPEPNRFRCVASIRNTSNKLLAENVSVRIAGTEEASIISPGLSIFRPGYDPFQDADLTPSNGSNSINPSAIVTFLFPQKFNELIHHIRFITVPTCDDQTFTLTVSCAQTVPVSENFAVRDGRSETIFVERILKSTS
jgi:hypothetical protein